MSVIPYILWSLAVELFGVSPDYKWFLEVEDERGPCLCFFVGVSYSALLPTESELQKTAQVHDLHDLSCPHHVVSSHSQRVARQLSRMSHAQDTVEFFRAHACVFPIRLRFPPDWAPLGTY